MLAVMDAGAYVSCMSSNYNMRARVEEMLVQEEEIKIIAERESYDDLIKRFRLH